MRLLLYIVLTFLIVLLTNKCIPFLKRKDINQVNIKLVENYTQGYSLIYLINEDNKILDSLKFNDLIFHKSDSVQSIGKNIWYYSYSKRCGSGCKIKNQIIFQEKQKKIQIMLPIPLLNSFSIDNLYLEKDTSLRPEMVFEVTDFKQVFSINTKDFINKPNIEEYKYEGKNNGEGINYTKFHLLKYNSRESIYYTHETQFVGKYTLYNQTKKSNSSIIFKNHKAFAIKIDEDNFYYINKNWYYMKKETEKQLILIDKIHF